MEVTTKSTTLWDTTPCSQVEVYRHFGGTYWAEQVTSKKHAGRITDPEDGGRAFLRNVGELLPDCMALETGR
jgi:hypothetical protein